MRGCRVDILVESENSPKTLVEVQMSDEPIMARNMFEYAHAIISSVSQGILTVDLYNAVPKIVVIYICNFPVRTTGNYDFLQPVKQMYTKNPEVAQDYLNIYNVQLPNFRNPKLRKEYDMFMGEKMRMSGIMHLQYERGKLDTARNMLTKGYSIDEISDITELPLDTIQTLTLNP
jgi:hypothetical protein